MVKSALAGVLGWALAHYVIGSPQPTYAPFVALLVVQFTVYRSLLHAGQYVAALVAGVLAAGAANPLLGENLAGFAAMLVVGLLVGRWRHLGVMGGQAPVAGVFAYQALMGGTDGRMLWHIVSMVLLGAAVGLAVNLLLLPPMRYATADRGIEQLSTAVSRLLDDMAAGLRDGENADSGDWLHRARSLDSSVSKARTAVEHGAESVSYNPRRLFCRNLPATFFGYRTMVESLARVVEQVRSMAVVLDARLAEDPAGDRVFLEGYADVLSSAADGVRYTGGAGRESHEELHRVVDRCTERCHDLELHAGNGAWPSLGALLTDACRLAEELRRAHRSGAVRPDTP
nr:aromatic acid exporter family protein [Streptomyces boncukensis]